MSVNYETYEDYPIEDLLLYAGVDCIATSGVASKVQDKIVETPDYIDARKDGDKIKRVRTKALSIAESYERYTAPSHEFIVDMELNGLGYDVEGNNRVSLQMQEEIAELEEEIFSEVGRVINLDSGDVLGKFLYEERGFTPPYLTKTGGPSTDGDAVIELAKSTGYGWLNSLAKRNDIASTWRTFVRTYVEDFVKRDGRIHPSYNLHGTSSFRISGAYPNLTQLPRPKHGYNVRDLFIVETGYLFIALDFSSAEVKVLGAISQDPGLLKAIEEGKYFHSFSAGLMAKIPYEEFVGVIDDKFHHLHKEYKYLRQRAKVLTFSILYGSSPRGIALQLGLDEGTARGLIDLYFALFPGIKNYVDRAHTMALDNHMVISPFGQRKQEFATRPIYKGSAVYNAALRNSQNVIIQGATSSIGLFAFTKVNEEVKKLGGKAICTVYDSIELEIPIARAAEALEIAFYCMNDYPVEVFDWLSLPIGVDAEVGTSWGNAQHINRGATQKQIEDMLL